MPVNLKIIIHHLDAGYAPYPMLVVASKRAFFEELPGQAGPPEDRAESKQLPKAVRRFFCKRAFLFSKFSEGIMLDEESWYSVIPEVVWREGIQLLIVHKQVYSRKTSIESEVAKILVDQSD